jgi:hypothetical protein
MPTAFPTLPLPLSFQEIQDLTGELVLAKCREIFLYDCTDAQLFKRADDSEELIEIALTDSASDFLALPYARRLIFSCMVAEKPQKQINHRVFFCDQMVSTEQTFVNDLTDLRHYWRSAITEARILTPDQIQALFQNLDPIFLAHDFFLTELRSPPVSFASMYGAKFLNFVQFFKIGASFVSKYKQMDAMIKELCQNHSFKSKWAQIEKHLPSNSGRDFLSYYITPVQRYPRYPLLLRDLYKATPAFHPDKDVLAAAI